MNAVQPAAFAQYFAIAIIWQLFGEKPVIFLRPEKGAEKGRKIHQRPPTPLLDLSYIRQAIRTAPPPTAPPGGATLTQWEFSWPIKNGR